ncbi:FAD:protein FMN transferase [bacterium]
MNTKKLILLIVSLYLLNSSCIKKSNLVTKTEFIMDTIVEISVIPKTTVNSIKLITNAMNEIKRIEASFDRYKKDSLVAKFNKREQDVIDPELYELIDFSLNISRISDGAFDITIAPLVDLWNFKNDKPTLPSKKNIVAAKHFIGWQKITSDKTSDFIVPFGINIDLGGMVKGYAVDRAIEVLKQNGIKSALVNAGGDIFALGSKNGNPWKIGIQDPRNTEKIIGIIELENKAIVTSGDYERFFMHNGVRYHHILDPKTGYPAKGISSVTITAESCKYADSLSTAVFVLGKEKGLVLIESLENVEGIIVTDKNELILTKGMKSHFKQLNNEQNI